MSYALARCQLRGTDFEEISNCQGKFFPFLFGEECAEELEQNMELLEELKGLYFRIEEITTLLDANEEINDYSDADAALTEVTDKLDEIIAYEEHKTENELNGWLNRGGW